MRICCGTAAWKGKKAEINALMENAIFAIFRDFPDAFLLFPNCRPVVDG